MARPLQPQRRQHRQSQLGSRPGRPPTARHRLANPRHMAAHPRTTTPQQKPGPATPETTRGGTLNNTSAATRPWPWPWPWPLVHGNSRRRDDRHPNMPAGTATPTRNPERRRNSSDAYTVCNQQHRQRQQEQNSKAGVVPDTPRFRTGTHPPAKRSYYKTKKEAETHLERVHLREQLVITEKPLCGVRVVTLRHLADYAAVVTVYTSTATGSLRCGACLRR